MRHIAYTLGIFYFSQGLYANIQGKLDTSFNINKPAAILPNTWISALMGYPQGNYNPGTPKIICNFRNLPSANLFVGSTNLHSAWLLNPKYSPSKISPFVEGKQNYSSFLHEKSLFTHHRISFVENYFQQEHSLELQLPISRKTSIFTGIGIIHTNQYGFKNSPVNNPINTPNEPYKLPVIGKIQVIKTLPNSWSFISNLTFTTSAFNHDGKPPSTPLTHPSLNQYQGTLSLIENHGIPWYYSSMWNWNLQSAILVAGHTVKIPCLLRASIGNNGSIVGFSTWLPIQLSYLKQIEITYLSGESPLLIGLIGRTAYLRNKTNKNSFQLKASFLWNNNIGIMPQITFLFNS